MDDSENFRQLQVRFVSNQKISVELPSASVALPDETTVDQLNSMLAAMINEPKCPKFEFYINNQLLRQNLREHLKNSPIETEIEIECVTQRSVPEPESAFPHPDWVSDIEAKGNRILSACYDSTVRFWNRKGGELLAEKKVHDGPVKCLAFLDEGNFSLKL